MYPGVGLPMVAPAPSRGRGATWRAGGDGREEAQGGRARQECRGVTGGALALVRVNPLQGAKKPSIYVYVFLYTRVYVSMYTRVYPRV